MNTEPELKKRNFFARLLFSFLWLLPVIVMVAAVLGAIVGGFAGASTTSFEAGHSVGRTASEEFFVKHKNYIYTGQLVIWFLLCFFGKLPGTGKYKRIKKIKK